MWWSNRPPDLVNHLPKLIIAACVGSEKTRQHDLEHLRGELAGIDERLVLGELFALRMAVAILAAQQYVEGRLQVNMRKAFAQTFHALLTQASTECVEEWLIPTLRVVQASLANARKDPNAFIDFVNDRAKRYLKAYTSPAPSGKPLFAIGKVFCELCGADRNDARVAVTGIIEFTGTLNMALTVLQARQRLPGGEIITVDPNWKSPFEEKHPEPGSAEQSSHRP